MDECDVITKPDDLSDNCEEHLNDLIRRYVITHKFNVEYFDGRLQESKDKVNRTDDKKATVRTYRVDDTVMA